jgi:hypothetical protein
LSWEASFAFLHRIALLVSAQLQTPIIALPLFERTSRPEGREKEASAEYDVQPSKCSASHRIISTVAPFICVVDIDLAGRAAAAQDS